MAVSEDERFIAVGVWAQPGSPSLYLLSTETLEIHDSISLNDKIPRSLCFVTMPESHYLMIGMGNDRVDQLGDGHLIHFTMDPQGGLIDKKNVVIGTGPIGLVSFQCHDKPAVFASCGRNETSHLLLIDCPCVIYSHNGKLSFSNVNTKDVLSMCPFSTPSMPNTLALATESGLTIGSMEAMQKLHIKTVPSKFIFFISSE